MSQPSDEEIKQATRIIESLPRGYLPYPLFMAIASKVVTPTLELVIFHEMEDGLGVLLIKRPEGDRYWPGQWHIPGTVIRSTDMEGSFESCFQRLLQDELKGKVTITSPTYVDYEFWDVMRGREFDQLFYSKLIETTGLPEGSAFFQIDALPDNIISHHVKILSKVSEAYNRQLS